MSKPSGGALRGPIGYSTARPRWETGEPSTSFAGSTSRPFGLLLDAASSARIERFVHVSSLGVYEGRDHYGTDETVPPAANSLDAYTRSKAEAEALAIDYHKKRGLPVAVIRPGFIYGERDRTVLPKLLVNLRRGSFAYFGSGEQALNCIYVKNLVHGLFLAAENPAAIGEVFNLTDGESVSKNAVRRPRGRAGGIETPVAAHPALAGQIPGDRGRESRQASRCQEPADHQQGEVQVPGLEPRLFDREGTQNAGLRASVHVRARHRAGDGRAPSPRRAREQLSPAGSHV